MSRSYLAVFHLSTGLNRSKSCDYDKEIVKVIFSLETLTCTIQAIKMFDIKSKGIYAWIWKQKSSKQGVWYKNGAFFHTKMPKRINKIGIVTLALGNSKSCIGCVRQMVLLHYMSVKIVVAIDIINKILHA